MASVMARSAAISMGLRGASTAVICATALPRRVMHTGSPPAASSTSRLNCVFASARLTLFTRQLLLTSYLVIYSTGVARGQIGGRAWLMRDRAGKEPTAE